jgi:hypothetical protein
MLVHRWQDGANGHVMSMDLNCLTRSVKRIVPQNKISRTADNSDLSDKSPPGLEKKKGKHRVLRAEFEPGSSLES